MSGSITVQGRLVLADRVTPGRIVVEDDRIVAVEPDAAADDGPYIAPGFIDVHCHGWGGHDAMGGADALDGTSRALLRHGVTSFLPTGYTLPVPDIQRFCDSVRAWMPVAPEDGAQPLGFNLEGPFVAPARKGAHNPDWLRAPADLSDDDIAPFFDGLRITTIAPELPGALELIARLRELGVVTSISRPPIVNRPSGMPATRIASLTRISRSAGLLRTMIGHSDGWTWWPSAMSSA